MKFLVATEAIDLADNNLSLDEISRIIRMKKLSKDKDEMCMCYFWGRTL